MNHRLIRFWKSNKAFLVFLTLMFVFRSSFADWNAVPTGSMQPTIVEGDRILVNKLAYDVRLPFMGVPLFKLADPRRGDIVIFDSSVSKIRLVKRVVGVPGDVVELKNNQLYINSLPLAYKDISVSDVSVDKVEDLLGIKHMVRINQDGSSYSSFPAITVPENNYLVLGDNRDNSSDSRAIGFVPRSEIVGRTRSVVMSLNYENYFLPRSERFFKTL